MSTTKRTAVQKSTAETSANISAEETSAKQTPEKSGVCAYIGPTILGVIQRGTIYSGSKEQVLKKFEVARAIGKYPAIADLMVTMDELVTARIKVKTPGESLYKTYKAIYRRK